MRLIDSNILIYAAQEQYEYLRELLEQGDIAVSELTKLEVLGYHSLTEEEENYFNAIFTVVEIIPMSTEVVNKAIELRRGSNMKSADAIIAATALLHCDELITRNVGDFTHIQELTINNPID